MSYERGCQDYTAGFSLPFFMAATVLGFVLLWKQHIPESIYYSSVPFFLLFSVGGFMIFSIAYTHPVWFYELMEGEPDP